MITINFAYPEIQTVIETLKAGIKGEYGLKNIWKLMKVEEKIEDIIHKKYKGKISEYHDEGQKEIDGKAILDLVQIHSREN